MNMNDLFKVVMELDLDPIKVKLMHVESGESWSQAKANVVEKEYRRFLWLMKMYPNESIAPLVDVDTFWHYHILDTMKYARDCEQVFGYFLHHYPYVGMRGGEDEQFRLDSGERMRTLYEATFGDSFAERAAELAQATAVRPVPVPGKPGTRHIDLSGLAPSIRAGMAAKASSHPQVAAAAAYCAGPMPPSMAYCAGPMPPSVTVGASTVPGVSASARPQAAAATAYCAGPMPPSVAYCAGPMPPSVAYCAGPMPPSTKAASRAGESLPRPALQ